MLPDCSQNYTSIGVATILVFLNFILLHERYKFVDMTIRYMYRDSKRNIMPVIMMHAIELSRVIDTAIYFLNIFVF